MNIEKNMIITMKGMKMMNDEILSSAFRHWLSDTCNITVPAFLSLCSSTQKALFESFNSHNNNSDIVKFISSSADQSISDDFRCYLKKHKLTVATFKDLDIKLKTKIYNNYWKEVKTND